MATSELACTYASLILYDDGLDVTADNIAAIVKAAGIEIEPFWPGLFAKLFETKSVGDLITNVGSGGGGGGGGAAAGGAAAGGGGAAAAAPEPEPEEEEEEDMDFDLFD
mmetsp:Transcript_5253/g.13300  ORF Transcript_5253/g.13300 Transcript_5253/m.13300 type:complete len:109 (-) Transcript_5253:80-406(-)|eukprot:jgi/Tetstr1/447142/TSEL_034579.t1